MKLAMVVLGMPIGIALTLAAWSVLSGIVAMIAVVFEDRRKCNYSFAAAVSQMTSAILFLLIFLVYGLMRIWSV